MATRSFRPFIGDIVGDARRIEERTRLRLPAMLHVEGGPAVAGEVTDVTTRGCRIETDSDAAIASYVTIVIADATLIGGRVAWRGETVLGVDFCARLMPKAIARILALGTPRPFAAIAADAPRGASPQDDR